jgi:hypothetical protein
MRCALDARRRRRRRRQAQQGRSSTHAVSRRSRAEAARMLCSITAILVRNCGLGTARFAELAAGAGTRLRHPLKRRGAAYKYTGESRAAAKNGPMRDFGRPLKGAAAGGAADGCRVLVLVSLAALIGRAHWQCSRQGGMYHWVLVEVEVVPTPLPAVAPFNNSTELYIGRS